MNLAARQVQIPGPAQAFDGRRAVLLLLRLRQMKETRGGLFILDCFFEIELCLRQLA